MQLIPIPLNPAERSCHHLLQSKRVLQKRCHLQQIRAQRYWRSMRHSQEEAHSLLMQMPVPEPVISLTQRRRHQQVLNPTLDLVFPTQPVIYWYIVEFITLQFIIYV